MKFDILGRVPVSVTTYMANRQMLLYKPPKCHLLSRSLNLLLYKNPGVPFQLNTCIIELL